MNRDDGGKEGGVGDGGEEGWGENCGRDGRHRVRNRQAKVDRMRRRVLT